MTTTLDLAAIHLDSGNHLSPDDGMCIMEAVALMAGESFTDAPSCASPVIGAFLRSWNDTLGDDERQDLKQYIPRVVGTAGIQALEDRRAFMAMDWLVRECTPAWLRLAGLTGQANRLETLPEFRPGMDVPSIRPVIDAVRSDAAAAWAAARDAARAAAWDAARAAAGDAARAAARAAAADAARAAAGDAARDAARDAAWAAAGDAAWDAAGDAARDAARAAAGDAARAAAGDAAWAAAGDAARAAAWDAARAAAWDAARAAAWDAARDALTPTVTELQQSAHRLIDRMIEAK